MRTAATSAMKMLLLVALLLAGCNSVPPSEAPVQNCPVPGTSGGVVPSGCLGE
jgi:hypothetical protein